MKNNFYKTPSQLNKKQAQGFIPEPAFYIISCPALLQQLTVLDIL